VFDGLLGKKISILMYHSVNPSPDSYSVSPEAFRRQMELLKEHYSVVALKDVPLYLRNGHERVVAVTFDDAFRDFEQHAYPVLCALNVPATVFVPTAFVGRSNSWDREFHDISPKSILSKERLCALSADARIDFGSHTIDHLSMRQLSTKGMRQQATGSRQSLEDALGRPITMFSYPFGQRDDFSAVTERILRETGYTVAVTTCWGTRQRATQALRLRRIWLKENDDARTVRAKTDGAFDWIGAKELAGFTVRLCAGRTIRRPNHSTVS
jgi:peptidoglycan/xylan/chitin deacetylase (PgdA/CDA1 family)